MMYDDTPEKGGARAHRYGSSIDYATITRAHGRPGQVYTRHYALAD